jgi:hypothetical protein
MKILHLKCKFKRRIFLRVDKMLFLISAVLIWAFWDEKMPLLVMFVEYFHGKLCRLKSEISGIDNSDWFPK